MKEMGVCRYQDTYAAMRALTESRDQASPDECWYLQHEPVYTLGLNGKRRHLLTRTDIPLVETDRGGQITYHGPGQLVCYLLLDLSRYSIGIKEFVTVIEQAVMDVLLDYDVSSHRLAGSPGIYVDNAKIAALGLRVRRGHTYHGLALNVDMDLTPFHHINPCGYEDMQVTQLHDIVSHITRDEIPRINAQLHAHLLHRLEQTSHRRLN